MLLAQDPTFKFRRVYKNSKLNYDSENDNLLTDRSSNSHKEQLAEKIPPIESSNAKVTPVKSADVKVKSILKSDSLNSLSRAKTDLEIHFKNDLVESDLSLQDSLVTTTEELAKGINNYW